MEKLIINIPESKSTLVRKMLKSLSVLIQSESQINSAEYKQKLTNVSTWPEYDLKVFEESKKAFEVLKR